MRYIILLVALGIAACSNAPSHELPQTSDKDPTWQLNEGKWTFNENALVTPPPEPADRRLPAAKAQAQGL
jgi:hypothetical protein